MLSHRTDKITLIENGPLLQSTVLEFPSKESVIACANELVRVVLPLEWPVRPSTGRMRRLYLNIFIVTHHLWFLVDS